MSLHIDSNRYLNDISALESVKNVIGDLKISYNPKLKDLNSLKNFEKIGEETFIEIKGNSSLSDFCRLSQFIKYDSKEETI